MKLRSFRLVAMRCRESLLALDRGITTDAIVQASTERPPAGDFIYWSELISDKIASGPSAQEVRGYLKHLAKSTCQLVQWLVYGRFVLMALWPLMQPRAL
jgi:hypothetical protein